MTVYYAVVTINNIIFDNVVAYAKRSKVDVNAMKRDHFTTLLLKKKTCPNITFTVPEYH